MLGWCTDFFRALVAFLYWNAQKSVFRLRGAKGQAPCQNSSDSGRPFETTCDACLQWSRPLRFRRVCPLLVVRHDGAYSCSVGAHDVRPFWGRAVLVYLGLCGLIYATGVLLAFGFLRHRGYELGLIQVGWPPAWSDFGHAQSQLFFKRGQTALSAGQINEAVLSLSIAYERDPENAPAGLLLAQLWQTTQPALSDRLYSNLLRQPRLDRMAVAQTWCGALLRRGNFQQIVRIALEALRIPSPQSQVWELTLVEAFRLSAGSGVEPLDLPALEGLPDTVKKLLDREHVLRTSLKPGSRAPAMSELAPPAPSAVAVYQIVTSLVLSGHPADALAFLDRFGKVLDTRTLTSLRLDGFAAQGWPELRQSEIDAILRASPGRPGVEIVCAHLIRFPDTVLAARFFDWVDSSPPSAVSEGASATYAALFCLAGVEKNPSRLEHYRKQLESVSGRELPALAAFADYFLGSSTDKRLGTFLPFLPAVTNEVAWSLHKLNRKGLFDVPALRIPRSQ